MILDGAAGELKLNARDGRLSAQVLGVLRDDLLVRVVRAAGEAPLLDVRRPFGSGLAVVASCNHVDAVEGHEIGDLVAAAVAHARHVLTLPVCRSAGLPAH